ncbi:hypothetical protein GUITHDRAFT_101619 [Guillardia theta CCMP2712]|uniref:Ubiquitin-like-conjugating enzyme ATG10 n=1 Tax=Guillardia theta (strain CCMP2712) TaxID=905079 RepID=L1JWH6_GUITC|nr:hypothetical protein GUITHDRAFT_101619 [Guillardia theta CCMP2712]EKX52448.1 hypothetical protein GUITHDRAFT_101619 [Guillardia theta CCMP2712]|eukprot:XP_005839428.1 hypothetical protein GUITHDRAFT_101619 [Guillardia theta CCMP2712]
MKYEEFQSAAMAFMAEANDHGQEWKWVPNHPRPLQNVGADDRGYLALEEVYREPLEIDSTENRNELDDEDSCTFIDPSVIKSETAQPNMYRYHVVYVEAYQCPVLFLQGKSIDGRLLDTEYIWRDCCGSMNHEQSWLTDSCLPTPEEHPVTGEPFHFVHPCRSKDFMDAIMQAFLPSVQEPCTQSNLRYFKLWLSVYGQAVGLRLPLALHSSNPHPT